MTNETKNGGNEMEISKVGFAGNNCEFKADGRVAYGSMGIEDGDVWYGISHAPTPTDFDYIADILDNMTQERLKALITAV